MFETLRVSGGEPRAFRRLLSTSCKVGPCPQPRGLSTQQAGVSGVRGIRVVLAFCFLLSGFAALVYQTAWTRQFALVFGTSELAVATVLAAHMGGLALGAWLVERWLPRVSRPVLVYAG